MLTGHCTVKGTLDFYFRHHEAAANGFFRETQGLKVSSLGMGTYLGSSDEATDLAYIQALDLAIDLGVNFIDTALVYRDQHSERCVAEVLKAHPRDRLVIGTKAGYLSSAAFPSLRRSQIAGDHSLDPDFLEHQLDRSLDNLGLKTVDIFYLHNPEEQLRYVSRATLYSRIRCAFKRLEQAINRGKLLFYGIATWNGLREAGLLEVNDLVALAVEAGGEAHHFRFLQLPFNLGMTEALLPIGGGVLAEANRLGLSVIASASLLQGSLVHCQTESLRLVMPGLASNALRSLQFVRSTPGIAVALAGMRSPLHVRENASLSSTAPLAPETYLSLFKVT